MKVNRAICLIVAWLSFLGAVAFLIAAVWGTTERRRLAATAFILGAVASFTAIAATYLADMIEKAEEARHRALNESEES